MSMTMRCKGCGALLQMEHKDRVGYVISLEHDYCQSCFRLMHYGESFVHFHPEDLPSLPKDSIIVMVSSILHLDLLFSYPVYRYQPDAKYIYLINQVDLLPKGTNLEHLLKNVTHKAKSMGIPYEDIILMSAKNPYDIDHLKAYLSSLNEPNVYFIGVQNSGKTTLYKAITGDSHALSMKKAGLTQDVLSMPFQSMMIYDLPGLYQEGYLHQFYPYNTYKRWLPDEEISPRIYQLIEGQSILIESLLGLSFYGQSITPIFYLGREVKLHRTQDQKVMELLKKMDEATLNFEIKTFKIPNGLQQITIADMGFIHMRGPGHVKLYVPKGLHVTLAEALFND